MANERVNKVVLGSETLIDITDTTATADKVLTGYDFYNSAGVKTTGTASLAGASVSGTRLILPSSMGSVSGTNLNLV